MASAQTDEWGPDRRLDEILAAYLEEVEAGRLPDRREWIAKHPELAAELATFFANLDHVGQLAGPFMDAHPGVTGDLLPFPAPSVDGARIAYFGDYELLGELGRGGMGIVYAARQVSLDRMLALKVLSATRPGSEADIQRFEREAMAAAGLDHPHIVPIYEVGEHDGRHYFGMKLVDGGSLAQHAGRLKDDFKAAAKLMAKVARALQYAHQRGVLHRDLKPANVLLDRPGEPFLADFGLARRVEADAGLTASGSILGTPAYMAPEQAEGRREAITTAVDVYGLGAVLYELLTGQPPFQGETLLEILSKVREEEPIAPSRLNPKVPRDLETIALKCLEKDPRRRYGSAEAVADDLERWLAGVPIAARPASTGERLIKWARRRPAIAALLVASALTAAAMGAAVQGMFTAATLREDVREARKDLQRESIAREKADADAYFDRIAAAERAWRKNDVPAAERLLDECPARLRRWEWYYLKRLCHPEVATIQGHSGSACGVAFAPEVGCFTTPGKQGGVSIWDARKNRQIAHLRGHDGTVFGVAFDPRGERLATAGSDGRARVWNVATGRLEHTLAGHGEWATGIAFSPDGRRIASGGADRTVRIWDALTGEPIRELSGHAGAVFAVAFPRDGETLASGGEDGEVVLWNVRQANEVRRLSRHGGAVRCLAFSPDGSRLASGGADRLVRVWDVAKGEEILSFHAADARIDGIAYSPDGRSIATGGLDRSVKLWDARNGHERASYPGHAAPVFSVAFSQDGRLLASASQDAMVKLWDAQSGPESRLFRIGRPARWAGALAFKPDGLTLAVSGLDQGVDIWDVESGHERPTSLRAKGVPTALAYDPSGELLAQGGREGGVTISNAATGEHRQTLKSGPESIASIAFHPSGARLVTGDGTPLVIVHEPLGKELPVPKREFAVRLWDIASGRELARLRGHVGPVYSVTVSPDGSRIASSGADGTVRLWDSTTGEPRAVFQTSSGQVLSVAFSPDGKRLASADFEGTIRLHELASGKDVTLTGHNGWVRAVAFTSDGTRLASAGGDGTIRIWDPASGREILALQGHRDRVITAIFRPDGQALASAGDDGSVRVWDAPVAANADSRAALQGTNSTNR